MNDVILWTAMLATHSENNCIRCVLDGWIALVSKWFQLFLKIATDIRCIKNDHNSSANLLMSCCMTCWEYPLSELEHFHVNQLFYGQSSLHDYEKTHLSTHVETKGRGEDALKHETILPECKADCYIWTSVIKSLLFWTHQNNICYA